MTDGILEGKKVRQFSCIASAGGCQGAVVSGIPFPYTAVSKKRWAGGYLAFSLHRESWEDGGSGPGFFSLISFLCDRLIK